MRSLGFVPCDSGSQVTSLDTLEKFSLLESEEEKVGNFQEVGGPPHCGTFIRGGLNDISWAFHHEVN
jgi:hypothetical protein